MWTYTRKSTSRNGVKGVAFLTTAQEGSDAEEILQAIQFELSGGRDMLSAAESFAQLALVATQTVDSSTKKVIAGPTTIELWVPAAQAVKATRLLNEKGFAPIKSVSGT
jgi:hypothetical protein